MQRKIPGHIMINIVMRIIELKIQAYDQSHGMVMPTQKVDENHIDSSHHWVN